MKKPVLTSTSLGSIVVLMSLFVFQNCSDPIKETSTTSVDSASHHGGSGIPGAASNSGDLSGAGLSPQNTSNGAAGMTAFSRPASLYVTILYQGVLQRSPTSRELSTWAQYIGLGYGCTFIAQQVSGSSEFIKLVKTLSPSAAMFNLYKGVLNRMPSDREQAAAAALFASYNNDPATFGPALVVNLLGRQEFKTYCSQYENLKP